MVVVATIFTGLGFVSHQLRPKSRQSSESVVSQAALGANKKLCTKHAIKDCVLCELRAQHMKT